MYKKIKADNGTLRVNKAYEGETIEQKVSRILNNKEPIKDGAPLIYTEREAGVLPELDPRTDRQELLIDAMDKRSQMTADNRKQRLGEKAFEGMTKEQKDEFAKTYPKSQKSKDYGKEGNATSDNSGK
jgi:hypothetical protein